MGFLLHVEVVKGGAGDHEMVLSHSNQQAVLSEVILEDEYLISFNQNERVVSSDLTHHFHNLFFGAFTSHECFVEPFGIILLVLLVDGWKVPSVPNLSIVEEIRAWCFAYVAVRSSKVQNRLKSHGVSILNHERLFVILEYLVVSLIHVDMVSDQLVGPSSVEYVVHRAEARERRQLQFVVLNVFIKRKQLGVGRRVVGLEEGKVEVVLLDRDVEDEADSAHAYK